MSTTVTYKGVEIATVENETKTLSTAGTYCESNIEITDVSSGGSVSHTVTITLGMPKSPSSFTSCIIYEWDGNIDEWDGSGVSGQQIGEITTPEGSTTVTTSTGGIAIELNGSYVAPPRYVGTGIWSDGMIGYAYYTEGDPGFMWFVVGNDGNLDINEINWSD